MEFRRGDKLFDAIRAKDVTEVGVAEFTFEDTSLLLFHAPPRLQCHPMIHSRSSPDTGISGSGNSSLVRPLTVLLTASMSRPLSAPPRCTRPCMTDARFPVRSRLQHSLR